MRVSVPFDSELAFSVSGSDLSRALSVLGDVTLKLTDTSLTLRCGRSRFTLPLVGESATFSPVNGNDSPLPATFLQNLQKAAPFMSKNKLKQWACSVRLSGNALYATNNATLIRVECDCDAEVTLPDYLVNYILKRGNPARIVVSASLAQVDWDDGSSVVAALSAPMYDSVLTMSAKLPTAEHRITDEWRAAFNDAVSVGEDEMSIGPGKMSVNSGHNVFVADVESSTLATTRWNPKFMRNVVAVATHLDLGAQPAVFRGDGCCGAIASLKYRCLC